MFIWFQPKWRHSDATIRLEAARQSGNRRILARLAKSDPDLEVRKAAIGRLKTAPLLATLALSDAELGARRCALERVQDPEILARIAAQAEAGAPIPVSTEGAASMFNALQAMDVNALLEASVSLSQVKDSALTQVHLSFVALAALVSIKGASDQTRVLTKRLLLVVTACLAADQAEHHRWVRSAIRNSPCLSMIATPPPRR